MNNLQLWNATNPPYACAELVVQYQRNTIDIFITKATIQLTQFVQSKMYALIITKFHQTLIIDIYIAKAAVQPTQYIQS